MPECTFRTGGNGAIKDQVDKPAAGSPNDLLWDGRRHIIRGHFRAPSDHQARDGLYRVMVDGFTVSDFAFQTARFNSDRSGIIEGARIPMKGYMLWDIMNDGAPHAMSAILAPPRFEIADPGWGW